MALNSLVKTQRLWVLTWLEDNYECKPGGTICKADVFSDYAEVCRMQHMKPVTNSLFGKLVKAVFPSIRTCRKGPRSDSRTHYAGLGRKHATISLPRVCPTTGTPLSDPRFASFLSDSSPTPSSSSCLSESVALQSDSSFTSSAPSSPSGSFEVSPIFGQAGTAVPPGFQFGADATSSDRSLDSAASFQHSGHQSRNVKTEPGACFCTPTSTLSSCSSGASAYEEALSEFEEMDLAECGHSMLDPTHSCAMEQGLLPMPGHLTCLCPSCEVCEHDPSPLEPIDDILGDLEPSLIHFGSSGVERPLDSTESEVSFGTLRSSDFGPCSVPPVQFSSSLMDPPVAPSPPASPPPPLSLMAPSDFGATSSSLVHQSVGGRKVRPTFLRRTMAMAAAKTTAQAAEGNPLAEGLLGVINTCQKIIKDRAQKRRRNNSDSKQQTCRSSFSHVPGTHHHSAAMEAVNVNSLVPSFVINLNEIPGSQNNFSLQESVLIFANEYRRMYQSVFDRLVRFEYAVLCDFIFSFWSQVKLQPNFSALLDLEPVRKQVLTYDKTVLQTFQDFFLANPLKMSGQQFGGFLQTIAFHLPFAAERAMTSLLPNDMKEEKMSLLHNFANALQTKAQVLNQSHSAPASTIMEINNY